MSVLLWRGITARRARARRLGSVVMLVVLSAAVVLTQLSFVPIDPSGRLSVYAVLILAPIALASLSLGTLGGTLLGLFAGTALYVHSIVLPLSIQELTVVTPLTSIGACGVAGFLLAVLFAALPPEAQSRRSRCVRTVLACLVVSLLSILAFKAFVPYGPTTIETILQLLLNTAIMALPCLIAFSLMEREGRVSDDVGLREAFRVSIFFVVALAFVVNASITYVSESIRELDDGEAAIRSEVNYICLQIDSAIEREGALSNTGQGVGPSASPTTAPPVDPIGAILDGYTMEQTGTVMILAENRIVTTDDGRLPVGSDVRELLGEDVASAINKSVASAELQRIVYDGALAADGDTGGYDHGRQVGFLLAAQQGDYTVAIIEPSSMVFRERGDTMRRITFLTLILLAAVFAIVTRLLSVTVARSIDQTNEALDRITSGDLDVRVEVAGTHEFKSLSAGINQTVDALNDLIDKANRRMEEDLATGRAIQEGALPRNFPAFPGIDEVELYASMDAAKEVGGDFYDFFEVDEHTIAFLIADVSGKGIPGALFMMAAKAEIQNRILAGGELGEAIGLANEYLCANNEAHMFVTLWAATLDWRTGLLTYVNAGHNFPLLRHGRSGSWEWLREKSGLFLGLFDGMAYRQKTLTLAPGDELALYTDGVNEAFNTDEETYGNDRLEAFLASHADERPEELTRSLRADVATWAQGAEQSDDVTILVLEYDARA